jgi:acyl-coenzyme A synthetase/AMP-(fatty) acid ligase
MQSVLLFDKRRRWIWEVDRWFLLDWFDEKPYIDLQTSGTTGIPKMIRTNKQMMNSALATGDFLN